MKSREYVQLFQFRETMLPVESIFANRYSDQICTVQRLQLPQDLLLTNVPLQHSSTMRSVLITPWQHNNPAPSNRKSNVWETGNSTNRELRSYQDCGEPPAAAPPFKRLLAKTNPEIKLIKPGLKANWLFSPGYWVIENECAHSAPVRAAQV